MHRERLAELDRVTTPYEMPDCAPMQRLAERGMYLRTTKEPARQNYSVNPASRSS